jgi:triacylglycerol lipase
MLARLQQLITLSWLGGVLAWAVWKIDEGQAAWAWVALAVLLAGYGLFMGLEFLILVLQRRGDAAPRASAYQLLKAWWGECTSAPVVFAWHQPFRSQAHADFLPTADAAVQGTGVVLIHGFLCNRGLWNPWMPRLRALGIAHIAVTLEPVFGSIDAYVHTIEAAVQRLQAATGKAPVIVAHSMGGMAARAWYAQHARRHQGLRGAASADVKIITVATPHQGTCMAHMGFARNAWQMKPASPWLQALVKTEYERDTTPYGAFTCFYSHCDNIVMPPSAATLPGADNRHVAGEAHVHLLWHPAVFEAVCEPCKPAPDNGEP